MGVFIERTLATFEAIATAIVDLRQRVEALEHINGERIVQKQAGPLTKVDPTVTMTHRPLDESDRSYVISVGESHYHL